MKGFPGKPAALWGVVALLSLIVGIVGIIGACLEGEPEGRRASPTSLFIPAQASSFQEPFPSTDAQTPSPSALETAPQPTPPPELVPYEGPVEHLFFHPLIVYPELAFDGDRMARGYDDWFVTVPEFKDILQSLYEKDYLLIRFSDLFEEEPSEGRAGKVAVRKKLRLPEGKKPLLLSVDDLNYYEYMRRNGNASRLVLDDQGSIAVFSKTPEGKEATNQDDEIVPIVDRFVEEHPDFSFRGAKGILALTGYEGILGYRTHEPDSPGYAEEKEGASKVVRRLKETGWSFAAHGWGHLDAAKASPERLTQDTERWKKEVEPLTGPTSVYIYPYGSKVPTGTPKHEALTAAGFRIFCSVGPEPYLQIHDGAVLMDRRHIDGMALRTQQQRLKRFFDADRILDPRRPPAAKGGTGVL